MSAKIKTEHKTKHVETLRVDPRDVKRGRNSRMIEARDYANTVRERALSIAIHGQIQPAEVRRLEDNSLELVLGFTRLDAVELYRRGFDAIDVHTGTETHYEDPNATLWVKIVDTDADSAFVRGIAENVERRDTTDLQDALAQQELRTTMGWSDTQIARFYGRTNQNRVMDLEKLLRLPEDVQAKVHAGDMALSIALLTLDLTPEERADIIARSEDAGGKVSGTALKSILRDLYAKEAEGTDPSDPSPEEREAAGEEDTDPEEPKEEKKTKTIKRSAKDLERFEAEVKADPTMLSDNAAELLGVLVQWFKGRRTDEYIRTAFNEYTS